MAGVTYSISNQTDWLVTRFNTNTGNAQWSATYDYSGGHEVPLQVSKLQDGSIAVDGFSSTANGVWDFAWLRFLPNGTLLTEERQSTPDLAISEAPPHIAYDTQNNIYIAGTTTGSNKDMQLIKIDSDFELDWSRKIDAAGLEDHSRSLAIDSQENPIVVGNSEKASGGTQITLAMFTPEGELMRQTAYHAPGNLGVAEVARIRVGESDDIFLAGSVKRDGNWDFVTLMYDGAGTLQLEQFFGASPQADDFAENIVVNSMGGIAVTGRSIDSTLQYSTVKYEILERPDSIIVQNGEPRHKAEEFIVKFDPQSVDLGFVDNRKLRYGDIHEILKAEAADKISKDLDLRGAVFAKVFPRLSTQHNPVHHPPGGHHPHPGVLVNFPGHHRRCCRPGQPHRWFFGHGRLCGLLAPQPYLSIRNSTQ